MDQRAAIRHFRRETLRRLSLLVLPAMLFSSNTWSQRMNTLKANPLSLIIGNVGLAYERQINTHLSLQLGIQAMSINILTQDITYNDTAGTARLRVNGWGIIPSVRYFPSGIHEDGSGFYLEPYARLYLYNIYTHRTILKQASEPVADRTFTGRLSNFGLMAGYKMILFTYKKGRKISLDLALGPGISMLKLTPGQQDGRTMTLGNGFYSMFTSAEKEKSLSLRMAVGVGYMF